MRRTYNNLSTKYSRFSLNDVKFNMMIMYQPFKSYNKLTRNVVKIILTINEQIDETLLSGFY